MRQLKCPATDPSAERVTLNPNCENACTPSSVPLPPPFATAGPAAEAAGASAHVATNTAIALQNRLMVCRYLPVGFLILSISTVARE
jgi:hypothetical protein